MLIYIYQSHILLRKVWSHGMTYLIPYFLLTDKTKKWKTIYYGPDHVQLSKVNWRLKVNWENFQ